MAEGVLPNDCRIAREACQQARHAELADVVRELHEALAEEHKVQREVEAARADRLERFQRGLEGTLALVTKNALEAKILANGATGDIKTLNNRAWGLIFAVAVALILGAGGIGWAASIHMARAEKTAEAR